MKKTLTLLLCFCVLLSLSITVFAENKEETIVADPSTPVTLSPYNIPVYASVTSEVDDYIETKSLLAVRISWENTSIGIQKVNSGALRWNPEKLNYSTIENGVTRYNMSDSSDEKIVTITITNISNSKIKATGTFIPIEGIDPLTVTISNPITLDAATGEKGVNAPSGTIGGSGNISFDFSQYENGSKIGKYLSAQEGDSPVKIGSLVISVESANA